ncbi:MAG: rhomboid family intramembrane serine protease [Acidobacteria bacterium]|nr:rhomboid family intramembrane serine protease [Acidobacteriota bacterium]
MDKRRMCPQCRAFITTSDRICPYCDTKVGPRAADRLHAGEMLAGFIPHARFVTVMILTLNVGLYLVTMLYSLRAGSESLMDIDGRTLFVFGAKHREAIFLGQWWRLVTAGFLHGGLFHILMNSWVLFDLGAQVEEIFGQRRLIVIYFVSTVGGFMASTLWSPALSVGASAGVFGLIGAMIALGARSQSALGSAIKAHYLRWAVYGLLMGFLPFFRVDNAAHLGGLAAGFACAWLAGVPRLISDRREKIWTVLTGLSLALTAISFLLMFAWFSLSTR